MHKVRYGDPENLPETSIPTKAGILRYLDFMRSNNKITLSDAIKIASNKVQGIYQTRNLKIRRQSIER